MNYNHKIKKTRKRKMNNKILSIAGRPGLFRLVNPGKNMLIVESLIDSRRMPVHARDKVISLADVSMYTNDGDKPLPEILDSLKQHTQGKPVDIKSMENDGSMREFFAEILPDFDRERVKTSDIRKLFSWYNILVAADETDFTDGDGDMNDSAQ